MKNLLFILTIGLIFKSFAADAAYSTYMAQVSAGTGISVSGSGTLTSPFVIANTAPVSAPSFNNSPSVSLNTSNQLSTTKNCRCTYSVTIATAVSLLTGSSSGQAFLEISPNNSTWTEINRAGNSSTLTVGVTVSLGSSNSYNLQGEVPAGYYRRIRTTTANGGSVIYNSGQEVQY